MMMPSHLAATLLLGLLLGGLWPFSERAWVLALVFGVAIDLDHLLAVPQYVMTHGVTSLTDVKATMSWGANWQGFMHTPWALLAVIPAMLYFRSAIPLVFWGLHMVLDFVIARKYVVFGSSTEWVILAAMVVAIAALTVLQHRVPIASPGALGLLVAPLRGDR